MTFLSLFAGIGGFDLGFERAGLTCVGQVEIDPFCQNVLAKHWPNVRRWDDIRTFPPEPIDDWRCDVICGGFPCQDISNAGKRAGIDGERSGLWSEFNRIICTLRPRYVVVENVSALLVRGIGRVLGDMAEGGYDAEWDCVPAAAVGAPHIRDRVFIVAHRQTPTMARSGEERRMVADASGDRQRTNQNHKNRQAKQDGITDAQRGRANVADSVGHGLEGHLQPGNGGPSCFGIDAGRAIARAGEQGRGEQWRTEPDVGRVAHGVPRRVDRLRGLGNAIVPQVAEFIGRRLMETQPCQ